LYLLATAILSLILPFIKVESFKKVVPQNYIISLPEVVLGQPEVNTNNTIALNPVVLEQNSMPFWELIFYIGLGVAFCLFLFKVFKIFALVIKNPKQSIGNIVLVELLNSNAAFSFFHYIFLGERIKTEDKEVILKHELIHTQQKHTLDLLFFEVLRIVFWFNPFVYMYQNRMATLHEFIADANAVKHQNKDAYYQNLLAQVFETKNISFINTFFKQSLIKKRIVMLSKTKSKQIHLLKYALLIPLVFGMLVYTSAEAQEKRMNSKESYQELSGKELKAQFYKELLEMKKSGASVLEISEEFIAKDDFYIISRAAYYRDLAYKEYMLSLGEKPVKDLTKVLNMSYKDYLNYKKTDDAKLIWESDIKDGILRLVVNDKSNLTNEEKRKKENKIKLIKKDDYFHALSIVDIKDNGLHVQLYSSIFSANKRDDSKAALINKPGVNVGFDVVDQAPTFPGCEGLSNKDLKKCLTESVTNHIVENFNTDIADKLLLIGKQRIHVIFKIDTNGNTTGVKVKAQYPAFELEAKRVINTLPKMLPGKHKGKNVTVPYSLPIIFQINGNKESKETELIPLNEVEVPFAVIEQPPIFPGCENLTKAEQKKCISDRISKHVQRNFNTDLASDLGLKGRQRINVIFKIDTEGNIKGIRSRASHPDLEAEAIRVIKTLPKMIPGKQKGKAVTVPYSLPIIFQVADKTAVDKTKIDANEEYKKKDIFGVDTEEDIEVPFTVIEHVPVYPGCEEGNNTEKKKCMSEKISNFVAENFNTKIADENGLSGRQRINVIFKIDKEGHITGVRSRAPHPALEAEAIRVISSLPKMKPGMQKGKVVTVPYSLPIIFEVEEKTKMLDEVVVSDEVNVDVPFAVVEEPPIFPGCESLTKSEQKKCFANAVSTHVNKNFNSKLAKTLGLTGRQRINVVFKITKKGKIEIEKSRAPHPDLEAEAIRVIKSIPKLIPGKDKGKKVDVLYHLPIIFQVNE